MNKQAERALKKIAQREGVNVETVRREIELAIAVARENPDEAVQAFWRKIPCSGEAPTVEEVILHLAKLTKRLETQ